MNYFYQVNNLPDLKKKYREWAKKLHPDTGGDPLKFADMKDQYHQAEKKLNSNRVNLIDLIKKTINSPVFDDLILPSLLHNQKKYAGKLAKSNVSFLKYFVQSEEELEMYTQIIKNGIESFDIKKFIKEIIKEN